MAEDGETRASGASFEGGAGWALSVAGREAAEEFLREQTKLARLQAEELAREDRLRHWSLVVHHVSDVLKLTLEVSVALIAIAVVALIGSVIWAAAHDDGLVIEAFQVPPDFVARGHSGQVLASQLLDELTAMQTGTESARPARSYANDWGNDIKVQIADTGVSLGEFNRYLHAWLGHQTHIVGEVYQTAPGKITLTARVAGGNSTSFSGADGDVDSLLQKAAEQIYRQTQPYRYAVYKLKNLNTTSEADWREARQVLTELTHDESPVERAWAWVGLSNIVRYHDGDARAGVRDLQNALALQPDLLIALIDLNESENFLGHTEASFAAGLAAKRVFATMPDRPAYITVLQTAVDVSTATAHADFGLAAADSRRGLALAQARGRVEEFTEDVGTAMASEHDARNAKTILASFSNLSASNAQDRDLLLLVVFEMNVLLENWPAVVAGEAAAEKAQNEASPGLDNTAINLTSNRPWLALAKAKLGDFKATDSVIATTPLDCYDCVRIRGTIAALEHRWGAAEYWFQDAAAQGPSIPFAFADWGKTLLDMRNYDGAIEKFREANQKGPHFADPLEMWGEALMQENRSDLALGKFEEANKYAPNWGHLHLEWGEALVYAGKRGEAKKQFALASTLDLSPGDKAALANWGSKK